MTTYFFPDNTVLINFTHLDRHDLLTWFVRGRGAWTLSVAREASQSAQIPELAGMSRWSKVFGKALVPNRIELEDSYVIADQMRQPGDTAPGKHMGEAEAIAIIVRRQIRAVFLTDDFGAAYRAAAEPLIDVASTAKILALAEVVGKVDHEEAHACFVHLLDLGRGLGSPSTLDGYDDYVNAMKAGRAQQK